MRGADDALPEDLGPSAGLDESPGEGLSVRNLACARAGRPVFRRLSFDAAPGQLLQVRGANGSGKSSLLRLLCGLLPPVQGEIYWQGQRIDARGSGRRTALAADVAYMGHASGMNGELSVMENLRFAVRLAGRDAPPAHCREVLQRLGLQALAHAPARRLSQGQMRRLVFARVLLSQRRLWLLDEPSAGLDAQGEQLFAECLVAHGRAGGIAIVTTHQDLSASVHCARTLTMNASPEPLTPDPTAHAGRRDPAHRP